MRNFLLGGGRQFLQVERKNYLTKQSANNQNQFIKITGNKKQNQKQIIWLIVPLLILIKIRMLFMFCTHKEHYFRKIFQNNMFTTNLFRLSPLLKS